MKKQFLIFFVACFWCVPGSIQAQNILSWMELSATKVTTDFETMQAYDPEFFQGLYERNNTEVMLSGYIIPMDVEQNTYVLSMTPFSNCFFCGQAGIETVVELHFSEKNIKFSVDDYVVLTGVFRLHKNPGTGFIYSLRNAKVKK
ncbi:MAG: hypothetical protein JJU02_08040 [Cryomorphaceae bacterium]|nr:hypothetical protein [Cryomorphaceae bacterium]